MTTPKKGLGRGIGAFFSGDEIGFDDNSLAIEVDINLLEPNPNQPRKEFEEMSLTELSKSIEKHGILQPLLVSREDSFYRIIAGERRYRAARIAGLRKLPVIIREAGELARLQMALVENIHRKDINVMEEAYCYKTLSEEFSLTQEEVADSVSKSRSTVANCMRLLNLDERVQRLLMENRISMGHGRAVLSINDPDKQFELANKIIENELNVRETEKLVKEITTSKPVKEEKAPIRKTSPFLAVEGDLASVLGTKVAIKNKSGKSGGKIEIDYYSDDDLDRIITLIRG